MKKLKVLSLFDGMSCGQIALNKLGINNYEYYASEIKKNAIKVTQHNYPNTIQIGDVTKVRYLDGILYTENGEFNVGEIDLLFGGSPCQDFSIAKFRWNKEENYEYGLAGNKSILFYDYLRILKEVKPKYFLLENVRMKNDSKKQLDEFLEVEGLFINSNLVSYQNRPRYYWTNIPNVTIPEDRNISFQNYKESNYEECKKYKLNNTPSRIKMWSNGIGINGFTGSCANVTNSDKVYCLTRKQDRSPNSGLVEFEDFCRFLTRKELEQAQTVPIGYTDIISYNQAQDLLGDGWTVDVIVHIFSFLPEDLIK